MEEGRWSGNRSLGDGRKEREDGEWDARCWEGIVGCVCVWAWWGWWDHFCCRLRCGSDMMPARADQYKYRYKLFWFSGGAQTSEGSVWDISKESTLKRDRIEAVHGWGCRSPSHTAGELR
ncbi:hypothetical protein EX30DRAFT_24552 [Ascodesmis nigricans]|uniref:Uncharacterized protein n=1 Tax=Ascodesmis nigricans TaxID=341454 RepID=A0A4S2N8E1_9PEZI|nr:hypothetical protein EX30DRAFT_24552 [Ascodesmis nigricans]